MRRSCLGLIALPLLLAPLTATSQSTSVDEFAQKMTIAETNVQMVSGAVYDQELGTTLQKLPDFDTKITACLNANPGAQSVHGYFEFQSKTQYRLVLEPKGPFADCLTNALEGRAVPAPPSVPYLNPFSFTHNPLTQ